MGNGVATTLQTVDFLTPNTDLIRIQCTFPKDNPVMNFAVHGSVCRAMLREQRSGSNWHGHRRHPF